MLAKFSVKKPLTIFVAAIAVLVIGVMALMEMTPDLLPNINLPYVVVMTPYPGATPETVEEEVTRPLEQSMATLEDINNITSTSSENYSMVVLEFQDDADLDVVGVDISEKLDQVTPNWEDSVGTPVVMKINPSMMPVTVAVVDKEDTSVTELTDLLNSTLMNELEGTNGVASISSSGMIESGIHVTLSEEKLDAVNQKVIDAINDQFADSEAELADSREELEAGEAELNASESQIASGQSALDAAQSQASDQLASAGTELTTNKITLQQALSELDQQIQALDPQISTLQTSIDTMQSAKDQMDALESAVASAETERASASAQLTVAQATLQTYEDQIDAINEDSSLSAEEKQQQIAAITSSQDYLDAQASVADWTSKLATAEESLAAAQAALEGYETALGMTASELDDAIAEAQDGLNQLLSAKTTLQTKRDELEDGLISINEAMTELESQKSQLTYTMSAKASQLISAQTALESGKQQMESAKTQLDTAEEQLADAKEQALEQADVNSIITMDMVTQILTAQNFSMPAGYITDTDETEYMVRVGDKIADLDELKNLVLFDLGVDGLEPIRLSDVADVFVTDNSDEVYARINGNDGIILSFSKQSNYATATVSDNLQERFEELSEKYEGLHFTTMMDQGEYISIIVGSVLQNLLMGAILAVVILFLFLKNWRPTVIVACSIPFSVIFAIVLMYFSGISLNMISLSGLAIGVGMLVDNSVVVIENTYRLRSKGYTLIQSAVSGAGQVAGAITSSTLTTICVFLPIVFIDGITRELFTDLALTLGYSLIASLIVALTLVPAMSRGMMARVPAAREPIMDRVKALYERVVRWCLKRRAVTLILAVVIMIVSVPVAMLRGLSFMPTMESTEITATLTMPEGSTLEETAAVSDEAISRIQKIDGVETVGAMVSGNSVMSFSSDSGSTDTVTMYIMLDEDTKRGATEIAKEANECCEDLDGTLEASGASDLSAYLSMGGSGVTAQLYGSDLAEMQETATKLASKLEEVEGLTNISDGLEDTTPEITLTVNKNKAMEHGLTVAQIYAAVAGQLSDSVESTSLNYNGMDTTITIQDARLSSLTPDDLYAYEIEVTNQQGETSTVQLQELVDVSHTDSLNSISRSSQRRYLTISAEVEEGYNATMVTREAESLLQSEDLPAGMSLEFSGELETILESMKQLLLMLVLALILIYLIMVAQFQSLKSPFIVMFTIPLAFTGGFLALFLTGQQVSVISVLGFVMLSGIIVNNGIVLVDYVNQLRLDGMEKREALVEAGKTRIRPIFMTALTTVLGLVFIACGIGTGAEMMQPIGIVCIGGLLYATLMTLFVIPVIYDLLNKKEMKRVDEAELKLVEDR